MPPLASSNSSGGSSGIYASSPPLLPTNDEYGEGSSQESPESEESGHGRYMASKHQQKPSSTSPSSPPLSSALYASSPSMLAVSMAGEGGGYPDVFYYNIVQKKSEVRGVYNNRFLVVKQHLSPYLATFRGGDEEASRTPYPASYFAAPPFPEQSEDSFSYGGGMEGVGGEDGSSPHFEILYFKMLEFPQLLRNKNSTPS